MNISEFSKRFDISPYTIRFYEKEQIIKPAARTASGHRFYTEADGIWLTFVLKLKNTGMPLKQIRHYAQLRAKGDNTVPSRMELLEQHAHQLKENIAQQQDYLLQLENKIDYYRTILATNNLT